MAKIIFQPWIAEEFHQPFDELETLTNRFAILMFEAERRVLQLPEGEEELASMGPDYWSDEMRDHLSKVNDGKEPPRIQKIQLEREERNYLRELGRGLSDDERKTLRLRFEADFLLNEAHKLAPQIPAEKKRRDPGYPPMRKRALETMLDQLQDAVGEEHAMFMRHEVFHPGHAQGIRVARDSDGQTMIWDVQRDELHLLGAEKLRDQLSFLVSPCEQAFLDLEQNQNLRMLVLVYTACPSGERPKACEHCLPEGLSENFRIELGPPRQSNSVPPEEVDPDAPPADGVLSFAVDKGTPYILDLGKRRYHRGPEELEGLSYGEGNLVISLCGHRYLTVSEDEAAQTLAAQGDEIYTRCECAGDILPLDPRRLEPKISELMSQA